MRVSTGGGVTASKEMRPQASQLVDHNRQIWIIPKPILPFTSTMNTFTDNPMVIYVLYQAIPEES